MNVIDGKFSEVFGPEAAILTGPVIPSEYIFSRWLEFLVPRYSDILNKDYRSGYFVNPSDSPYVV
jgi:hypothetical protein